MNLSVGAQNFHSSSIVLCRCFSLVGREKELNVYEESKQVCGCIGVFVCNLFSALVCGLCVRVFLALVSFPFEWVLLSWPVIALRGPAFRFLSCLSRTCSVVSGFTVFYSDRVGLAGRTALAAQELRCAFVSKSLRKLHRSDTLCAFRFPSTSVHDVC